MTANYFNYQQHVAASYWDRRHFIRRWWSQQRQDKRWTPPHAAALNALLHPQHTPLLAEGAPLFMHMDGLARRGSSLASSAGFETTLATALLLKAPQQAGQTAYLSHFNCVNDLDSLETFFYFLSEKLWERGIHKAIGPCILSPHLQGGVLMDSFNLAPPLHTPYNAPYLPELLQSVMRPIEERHLYHINIKPEARAWPRPAPAQLSPLDPLRLARSLLPLFQAACTLSDHFPPPDSHAAEFLLRQIMLTPTLAWVARIQRQAVGFVLLQPDLGFALRRADGGRNWLWRSWLYWRRGRPVTAGRLLYMGVLPAWRGQGIGQQLLAHAMDEAERRNWHSLSVGPLPADNWGVMLLRKMGANSLQRYQIFETGF